MPLLAVRPQWPHSTGSALAPGVGPWGWGEAPVGWESPGRPPASGVALTMGRAWRCDRNDHGSQPPGAGITVADTPSAPLSAAAAASADAPGIGVGTWAWGNQFLWGYDPSQDEQLEACFRRAVALGLRFFDEGEAQHSYTYAKTGAEIVKQPGAVAYQIYDQTMMDAVGRQKYDGAAVVTAPTLRELAEKTSLSENGVTLKLTVPWSTMIYRVPPPS